MLTRAHTYTHTQSVSSYIHFIIIIIIFIFTLWELMEYAKCRIQHLCQIICTYFICVQLNNLQLYAVIARWFIDTYMQIWCILDELLPFCLLVILGPYHFNCTLIKLIEREKNMHKLSYDHWKRCSLNKDIKQYSAERFEQRWLIHSIHLTLFTCMYQHHHHHLKWFIYVSPKTKQ